MSIQHDLTPKRFTGSLVALIIVLLWLSSLELLLLTDLEQLALTGIIPIILGRTFLQTGLFVIAHDAIHGVVFPANLRLNHWIGRLAVTLFAILSYQKLYLNHWHHHHYPGQASDPDFHDGIHRNVFAWYLKFMAGYLDIKQSVVMFSGIGIIFLTLHSRFHIPVVNLLLFWVLPILLSSMQLFLFGTFFPHRWCRDGSTKSVNEGNSPSATSRNYPVIWSFLSCYHFGYYHWEHHVYPYLPWYQLPSIHKRKRQSVITIRQTPITSQLLENLVSPITPLP